MVAYKLVKIRKSGTLGSLFINSRTILPVGVWLDAKSHPTRGFTYRLGWHCCLKPIAPHLLLCPKHGCKRVWVKVEVRKYTKYSRPLSQGGVWILAERMKILNIIK